ncbi:MAG: CDP-alcohol phosphatidyltransferase family protein, partial [Candidatus Nanoarchaeia archaeon]|nr:CDP-alcohol phosphatidyltransferase family protein [Candidatus Nanoarchaeia archaeon]
MNFFEKIMDKRRKITDKILNPLINALFNLKISPNTISLLTGISLIMGAYFIHLFKFIHATIFVLISAFTDLVDGGLARKYKANEYGFVIDVLIDYCFSSLLIISIYSIKLISFELMLLTIASIFFIVITHVYQKLLSKKSYTSFSLPIGITAIIALFINELSIILMVLITAINLFHGT